MEKVGKNEVYQRIPKMTHPQKVTKPNEKCIITSNKKLRNGIK
jgi:hypothetical protein